MVGEQRVPASGSFPERRSPAVATSFGVGLPTPGGARPSGDGDGLETVEVWECDAECAVRLLDEQSGDLASGSAHVLRRGATTGRGIGYGSSSPADAPLVTYGDRGGASRFFFTGKANRADRAGSNHPTVKPVALMRWLVRLVTPRGGIVLDPFAGSGTTGQAALANGLRCVLIEKEHEYVEGIRKWRATMQIGHGL